MPFNDNLPAENTDPWYMPLVTAWNNLKTFVNGLETTLGGKADISSLGTAAAADTTDFATASQGGKADSAVQPSALAGKENTLVAGANVTIDRTNPAAPVISASGGGAGGAVDSVNGETGAVVLSAADVGAATAAQGALADSAVQSEVTATAPLSTPILERVLNYAVQTADTDLLKVVIQARDAMWLNEWGALRGESPYNWGDALVRAIVAQGTAITQGNAFEIEDRRSGTTVKRFGVEWLTGGLVQSGQQVGAVYTLAAGQTEADIPAGLPRGTLIVRRTA